MVKKKESLTFSWNGKEEALLESSKPTDKILMPFPSLSRDFDTTHNQYIIGDNLDALKILTTTHTSKIKLIYIDPPYNTGNKFIYNDNRSEDAWLNMMVPRLVLSRELLSEDGLICISIGEHSLAQLTLICDEIFGKNNRVGNVTVLTHPAGTGITRTISRCHDFLLMYCKNRKALPPLRISRTNEEICKTFKYHDQKGRYYLESYLNANKKNIKMLRPNQHYPIYVNEDGEISLEEKEGYETIYPIFNDGLEGQWTCIPETFQQRKDNFVARKIKGKWKIFRKVYAHNAEGESLKLVKSLWDHPSFYTTKGSNTLKELFNLNEVIFNYPKPVELIKEIVSFGTDKESIVLDFFSGSSTTAHAVMQKNMEDGGNRSYIMVQQEEEVPPLSVPKRNGYDYIHEVALKRIELASNVIRSHLKGDTQGDLGVKTYKILNNV